MSKQHEQLQLPIYPQETVSEAGTDYDVQAVARHIGEHATRNPYASQNRREAEIAERKAATHTPETLPEHLRLAMELAEARFSATAPGSTPETREEAIKVARQALAAADGGISAPAKKRDEKHITLSYAKGRGYFN